MRRLGITRVAPEVGFAGPVVVAGRPTGTGKCRLFPYGAALKGGVSVAVGDVNGDDSADVTARNWTPRSRSDFPRMRGAWAPPAGPAHPMRNADM